MDPFGRQCLILILLIVLRCLITAAQSALLRLNPSELEDEAAQGDPWSARLLRQLSGRVRVSDKARVISGLLDVLSGALAGVWFALPLGRWLAGQTSLSPALCSVLAFGAVILLLGTAVQLFGVQLPRRAARKDPRRTARALYYLWSPAAALFAPLTALVTAVCGGLLRLVHLEAEESDAVTEEEIRQLVDEGEERGVIESDEKEMIENIFEFNNMVAKDVMVHRTDVVALSLEDTPEVILSTIEETGLSRFPVYREDIDDVVGILSTRDYLLERGKPHPRGLEALLREAYFVPESVRTDLLFRDMQSRKVHLSVVVDEYGGTSGIVTMEDLLEEIVGNIYDEFDAEDEQEIKPLADGLWRAAGTVDLETLGETLGLELREDGDDYDTLGGLIFSQLSEIPEDGTQPELCCRGLHIQVERIDDRRVEWALVRLLPPEGAAGQEPGEGS